MEEVMRMIKAGAGTGQIEILSRYLEKDHFLNRYVRKDGSEEDCRLCPYYGKRWSCPPGLPHAYSYLEKYQNLCLVALKVNYSQETRRKAKEDTEYADQVREELYESAKRELLKKLLKLEKEIPGSKTLGAGRCILCEHCTREEGKPCRHPELRRYSITGFGLDFGKILEEVFGFPLLWAAGGLPEYDVAVAALFF